MHLNWIGSSIGAAAGLRMTAGAILLVGVAGVDASPPLYVLHELSAESADAAVAQAINDDGHIVGQLFGGCFALWTPVGGALGGGVWIASDPVIDCACPCSVISPNAIGNDGTVVGQAHPDVVTSIAWISANGGFEILDAGELASATDINSIGQIVGNIGWPFYPSEQQGFIIEAGDLSLLPEGYAVSSITDDGLIVGAVDGVAALIQRVDGRWSSSKLGAFEGESMAVAINSSGQVAGFSFVDLGAPGGFIWQDGNFVELGTLGGTYSSIAGITESGAVFGVSNRVQFGAAVAFLWHDGTMHEFNDLAVNPWLEISALYDANVHGQIVGYGKNARGEFASFVATPVDAFPFGDLNFDGAVDGADLGILLSAWGQDGIADLNGDGVVDGADLGLLLSAWTG